MDPNSWRSRFRPVQTCAKLRKMTNFSGHQYGVSWLALVFEKIRAYSYFSLEKHFASWIWICSEKSDPDPKACCMHGALTHLLCDRRGRARWCPPGTARPASWRVRRTAGRSGPQGTPPYPPPASVATRTLWRSSLPSKDDIVISRRSGRTL
jgi:hypothetical protein